MEGFDAMWGCFFLKKITPRRVEKKGGRGSMNHFFLQIFEGYTFGFGHE
jgi:hypothetical protein